MIDLYSGIGIGKNNLQDLDWIYPYGFTTFGDEFPLAMSFGYGSVSYSERVQRSGPL